MMSPEELSAVTRRLSKRVYADRELAKRNGDKEWLDRLNEELYVLRLALRLDSKTLKRLTMGKDF